MDFTPLEQLTPPDTWKVWHMDDSQATCMAICRSNLTAQILKDALRNGYGGRSSGEYVITRSSTVLINKDIPNESK